MTISLVKSLFQPYLEISQEQLDIQVLLDTQGEQDTVDILDIRGIRVPLAMVLPVIQVLQDTLDSLDIRDHKEILGSQVQQVIQDILVREVTRELLVRGQSFEVVFKISLN